jgi:hypothetical protein
LPCFIIDLPPGLVEQKFCRGCASRSARSARSAFGALANRRGRRWRNPTGPLGADRHSEMKKGRQATVELRGGHEP